MGSKPRMPLTVKVVIFVTLVALAASLVLVAFSMRNTRSSINRDYEDESHRLVELIGEQVRLNPTDPAPTNELLSGITRAHPELLLVRLFKTASGREPTLWASSLGTDMALGASYPQTPPPGDTAQTVVSLGEEQAFLNLEGVDLPGGVSSVAFYFDEARREALAREAARELAAEAVIIILAELMALALVVNFLVLRRVRRLGRAAETVAGGDLSARATPARDRALFDDELAATMREFDAMVGAVGARTAQQQAVADLGRFALEGASLGSVLEEASRSVARVLPADVTAVFEEEDDGLLLVAGTGWPEASLRQVVLPPGARSQSGWSLETGGPVVMTDRDKETRFSVSPESDSLGLTAGVSVPITGVWGTFGVLTAHQRSVRVFTDDDITFLTSMAIVLGAAVDRQVSAEHAEASEEERRQLLAQLMAAQEEERQRIALDLHDDPIQIMTAATLRLEAVKNLSTDERQRDLIERLEQTISGSIERLRALMFDLRPPALDREGLAAAVRDLLGSVAHEHPMTFQLEDRLEGEPDPDVRATAYRMVKEAVTNVVKHASAAGIRVTMDGDLDGVRISVADDGRGFDLDADPDLHHIGLATIKERAKLAGGWTRIDSAPGRGTTVEFFLPASERVVGGNLRSRVKDRPTR